MLPIAIPLSGLDQQHRHPVLADLGSYFRVKPIR
jgi:hypothetical protein